MFKFLFNRPRITEAGLRRFVEIEYPPLQRQEALERLCRQYGVM